jgi:putative tryptophan/tyrosine transport system substrate-binding protein
MRRREFITFLGGLALLDASGGRAQQPGRVYRLGIMAVVPRDDASYVSFSDELRRSGFVEGKNLQVDGRFSMRDFKEAPAVAALFVTAGVDAILTFGIVVTRAAQKATQTIPILAIADDLVLSGLVGSLAHPGGNTTGISILATELDGKRQELLTELVPTARHIAALADPANTAPEQLSALQDAARVRGIELSIRVASGPAEIVAAIAAAQASGAQALNVLAGPLLDTNRRLIIERTAMLKLPAIYQWPETAEDGGLAAYGPRQSETNRQRARQLVKIFRGTKAGDIPVEQPTKFELAINLKTAKALGLTIPPALFGRADEVIE